MNADMEGYYALNKQFLSRIGGWPYQPKVLKLLLPGLLVAVEFTVMTSQVLLAINHSDDIDMIVEGLVSFVVVTGVITKLINIAANNDKLEHLLRLMNDHWKIFNSESELHILRYYADIGRKVTKYYAAYAYTILLLFLIIPLIPRVLDIVMPLNESRPLIYVFEAEYGIDKDKYYYPILLHNYVSVTTTVMVVMNVDTMYIVCVLHACSLFAATGNRLENINGKVDNESNVDRETYAYSSCRVFTEERNSGGDDYRELLTCLKKHQLALEYAKMLDALFTYATMVLLIVNLIVVSVMGIQVKIRRTYVQEFGNAMYRAKCFINKFKQGAEVIRYGCLIIGTLVHLVCMCFPGQLLIERSTEVFDKTYSSRWYTFSLKSRKLLRILLYRSLIPSTLTAGKTYVMSMTMYSTVMHTGMSYFTTFLSMK